MLPPRACLALSALCFWIGVRDNDQHAEGRSPEPLSKTSDGLQLQEYEFQSVPGERGVWSAPNRAQGLRSRVSAHGIEVFPRTACADGRGADWKVGFRTTGFGRCGEADLALHDPQVSADGSRLTLHHGPVVEWFENGPSGIEQGWTVEQRPAGAGALRIHLTIAGCDLQVEQDGESATLARGDVRLSYRGLRAWDVRGRELAVGLVPATSGAFVEVDDRDATYPVTVDPTLSWSAQGDQAGAHFGDSVSTAGDVNGDGYDDMVVGARYYDNGETDEGRAYLYLGSDVGLAAIPAWTAEANQAGAHFGHSVSTAGDVNGDGYDDLVVGAPEYDNGEADEGRAYLYLGSASGLAATPAWTVEGDQAEVWLGFDVSTAGDVNGDGYDDVIVGAPYYENGHENEGRAYLYPGSATGLAASPAWTGESDTPHDTFGFSVSMAGDVNADGYGDVIVGTIIGGRAYVYMGSASGLALSPAWADSTIDFFGYSVSTAGDVNADGYDDVIVGDWGFSDDQLVEGRAYVYLGSFGGLAASPAWTVDGNVEGGRFGHAVSTAGDTDGDGYGDVIVGAPFLTNGQLIEGRAYVYRGSATGLSISASWATESNQADAYFGIAASAGDVNGDGNDDVLVGAPEYDSGEADEGGAFLCLGVTAPVLYEQKISAVAGGFGGVLESPDSFGNALEGLGDLDGDGVDDLAVGAPGDDIPGASRGAVWILLLNSDGTVKSQQQIGSSMGGFGLLANFDNFGIALASLGDIDGDGVGDLAVGAWGDDDGGTGRGAVWILFLNNDGTVDGYQKISATSGGFGGTLLDGDAFGGSLQALGDLDGDGVADLAVGAPEDDDGGTDRGAIWILFLNTDGTVKGQQKISSTSGGFSGPLANDDRFGNSIADLGDLDGVGGSARTLAVGAFHDPQAGAEAGAVWLLRLSSSGTVSSSSRITEGAGDFTGDLDPGDHFGYSVEGAGSIGGREALVVGARWDDDGDTDTGAAWILLLDGSGSVVGVTKVSSGQGSFGGTLDTVDLFGSAVAALGDLDGDGRTDLAVGASHDDDGDLDAGAVWVCFLNDGTLRLGASATTWDGSTDTDWGEASNWSNGVPDATKTAIIPDAATTLNDPQVLLAGQTCSSLWIQAGGTLELAGSADNLLVSGGATVSGPIDGTGELAFVEVGTLAGNATISNAGGVRADLDLTLQGGPLLLTDDFTANASVDVRGQSLVEVGGDFHAAGDLALAGSLSIDGAIEIEGNLTGSSEGIISSNSPSCEISVGGDLNFSGHVQICQVRLDNPSGEFIVVDVANSLPASLLIDFPAGGGVILDSDLTIEGGLEILTGSLDVQGNELILLGTLPVVVADTLLVGAGGRVGLETNSVTIESGGTLRLIGSPSDFASFDGVNGGGYTFLVEAGGTLAARNFSFEDMDGSGIVIDRDALIGAAPDDLRNGLFDRLATSGRLLVLERALPASFRYLRFDNTGGLATHNVLVPPTSAAISFVNWSGAFGGEANDDDAGGLLTWVFPNQETLVSSFTARRTLPASVRLDWTSTVEVDCEDFVLERGPSASGPWTSAGEVAASGPQGYVHQDTGALPQTSYHYRLSERLTHGALRVLASAYVPVKTTGKQAPPPAPLAFHASSVGRGRDYPSIQPALDALSLGLEPRATLVIEPGRYEPFELDGAASHVRHWQLVAAEPGSVVIDVSRAPLRIRGLDAGSSLELSGLVLDSRSPAASLVIEDCAGTVLLAELRIDGRVELDQAWAVLLQGSKLEELALDDGSCAELSTSLLASVELRGASSLRSFGLELAPRVEPGSRFHAHPARPVLSVTPTSADLRLLDVPPGSPWWILCSDELGELCPPALTGRDLERLGPARRADQARSFGPQGSAPGMRFRAVSLDAASGELSFSEVERLP